MTETRPLRDLGDHPVWVRLQGIKKKFTVVPVLDDVDVCFRPGRITAVLGPNGAGKTTLLKMILGLVRPDEGTVTLGEVKVNGDAEYRRDIGYMPQLPRFPENLSGWELAAMLDDLRGFRGDPDEELLEAFQLRDEMAKPFRTLSGGNRQKLNAALALRYGAGVLILDEPTAGLDPVAARVLKERVRAERDRGCTVLLTSHDLGQLQALADDVVFLLDGVVRFEGEIAELLSLTGQEDLEGAIAVLILEGGPSRHPGFSTDPVTGEGVA
ncbi:MAG TPA: ABC transporter ATP-binding protein [Longimicrobiales bacterium]|nr:ABC transporter ATP-binding protein [Longimicrobiales bacterium]